MKKHIAWIAPYASFLCVYVVAIALLGLLPTKLGLLFSAPFSMGLVSVLYIKKTHFTSDKPFSLQFASPSAFLSILMIGTGLILAAQLHVILGQTAVSLFDDSTPIVFIVLLIATPLLEEFFFRGILLHRMLDHFSLLAAVLGTAALFALLHGVQKFLYAFLAGTILALLTYYTKSCVAAMLAHLLANAGPIALCACIPSLTAVFVPDAVSAHIPLRVLAALLGLFLCGLGLWYVKKTSNRQE